MFRLEGSCTTRAPLSRRGASPGDSSPRAGRCCRFGLPRARSGEFIASRAGTEGRSAFLPGPLRSVPPPPDPFPPPNRGAPGRVGRTRRRSAFFAAFCTSSAVFSMPSTTTPPRNAAARPTMCTASIPVAATKPSTDAGGGPPRGGGGGVAVGRGGGGAVDDDDAPGRPGWDAMPREGRCRSRSPRSRRPNRTIPGVGRSRGEAGRGGSGAHRVTLAPRGIGRFRSSRSTAGERERDRVVESGGERRDTGGGARAGRLGTHPHVHRFRRGQMLRVTHGRGILRRRRANVEAGQCPRSGGGGTWGSRRAAFVSSRENGKSTAARGVGVSTRPPRPGRGASVRAYLGAARARGRGRRGGRSGRCLRGTRARRASSVAFARGIGRFAGGGRKMSRVRVLTVGRGVGGTRTTGEGVDGSPSRARTKGLRRRVREGVGQRCVRRATRASPPREGVGRGTSGPWRRTRCRLLRERLQLREARRELFRLRRGHRRALPHDRRRRRRHVETISGAREK